VIVAARRTGTWQWATLVMIDRLIVLITIIFRRDATHLAMFVVEKGLGMMGKQTVGNSSRDTAYENFLHNATMGARQDCTTNGSRGIGKRETR